MAKVKITGHASGSGVFTITAPNSNTDRTITLPDASVTLGTDATKLPLAGGTITGALTVNAAAVFNETSADVDFRVESNTNTHALYVNGEGDSVALGHTGKLSSVYLADGGTTINGNTLTVFKSGANTPGILELGGSSAVDNQYIGAISFVNNDNGNNGSYGRKNIATIVTEVITNDGNASDDSGGALGFWTKPLTGSNLERLRISSAGDVTISSGSLTINSTIISKNPISSTVYTTDGGTTITGNILSIYKSGANTPGILELGGNSNVDNQNIGAISFVNNENSNSGAYERRNIATITAELITANSNSGNNSGGDLVFWTKRNIGSNYESLRLTADGRGLSQFTAKAWARFSSTALNDSHNCSGFVDNGTGDYSINFTVAMNTSNYAPVMSGMFNMFIGTQIAPAVGGIRMGNFNDHGNREDGDYFGLAIFGD